MRWKSFVRLMLSFFSLPIGAYTSELAAQELPQGATVPVKETLDALVQDEDTDGDKKITIDDPHISGSGRGNKRFWISTSTSVTFEISGTYYLSNLLQELKVAEDEGKDSLLLNPKKIFEPPATRISRMIREFYWDGLTRRIDRDGLASIIKDEKAATLDGYHYVYVSPKDKLAFDYFSAIQQSSPELNVKVVRLPEKITPQFVRNLDGRHGILTLVLQQKSTGEIEGVPFVVPGGRFNEMYGWDSYFIVLGLLQDGHIELAKGMVEHYIYEIDQYGKILNANRSYFLTRSQPPFFTSMGLAVYAHLPKNNSSREWLRMVLDAAIKEYHNVWMSSDHLTAIGLSRYFDSGFGPPPEVEPGHFDAVFAAHTKKFGMGIKDFEEAYKSGKVKVPELDAYFVHDRAMRESGHDTSYRLDGRCADLATVDLNSLLYKIESDIGETIEKEFGGVLQRSDNQTERGETWKKRAGHRKDLMNRYLWNEEQGMFFDFDFKRNRQVEYVSATTLYPLWAEAASQHQAEKLTKYALPLLEMAGGIVSSTEESRGPLSPERPARQWDYPNGWAPHQMLAWHGFLKYGYAEIAHRLIYRWLYTLTSNAVMYNGTIPEKFDVATRSHQVFAEYGNVGTKFSYITREGFGWTNASYTTGLALLPPRYIEQLDKLIPPEWIF